MAIITIDLSSLDGSNGFRVDGEAKYDNWSSSVSNAGDVNGDGFDDGPVGKFEKADKSEEFSNVAQEIAN